MAVTASAYRTGSALEMASETLSISFSMRLKPARSGRPRPFMESERLAR